eukprot:scaffold878_cov271-Pinguiococcus_pyrenoidosus.AAC.21
MRQSAVVALLSAIATSCCGRQTRYSLPETAPDSRLLSLVHRNVANAQEYLLNKPPAAYNLVAYSKIVDVARTFSSQVQSGREGLLSVASQPHAPQDRSEIILDSGCGTGASTFALAKRFPDTLVVGVDRSELRLTKFGARVADNVNVDAPEAQPVDYWVDGAAAPLPNLLSGSRTITCCIRIRIPSGSIWGSDGTAIRPSRSYSRYVTTETLEATRSLTGLRLRVSAQLGERLVVRSNWRTYLDEFSLAVAAACTVEAAPSVAQLPPDMEPMTNFERKYLREGESVYELEVSLRSLTRPALENVNR